ncbi:tautomerase family protein [Rhodococcus pyridinivorans]|uniref:tautomerase family protein n=1 Tax=Rhodococcus pyridinivorans TaxID=103816 RepID=UPI003D7F332C
MPVAHFHLVDGIFTVEQRHRLLVEASHCYSEVLDSPLERVRTFIVRYTPDDVAVAGAVASESSTAAPYFTAIVLAGRPRAQREELAARFTDLIVDVLGVSRPVVRGRIIEVDPANWFIGGRSAGGVRADEVAARADGGSSI